MVRLNSLVSNTLRTAWSYRLGLALLLTVGLAGSFCLAVGPLGAPMPNTSTPATWGPAVTRGAATLPVELLHAVHGLDLEQPAEVELPKFRVSRREPVATPATKPKITMPALIAPANQPMRVSESVAKPSDDQPPTPPGDFQPEWRSSGKAETLADRSAPEAPDASVAESVAAAKAEPEATAPATPAKETIAKSVTAPKAMPVAPAKTLKPLTRNQIYLRNRLRKVLTYYYRKPLNSRDHDAWEAMHGMLSYGLHSRILAGGPRGESMTAIGWLCYNNPCKNKVLMRLNDEGEIRAQYGVGLQGHMGQFLAMLAQCNVDPSYPIRVEGSEFTINDLIASEQKTCYPNTELTFKLIGLMHYLPSDSQWVNDRGENWSMERLIEEELQQPVRGAACGGTHRLGGLSLAVRKRQARGEPVEGAFLKAADFTSKYEQYTYRLQNSDGSFSTEWFRGPGREKDIDRRCRTSGHLLEWLLYQVEDEKLTSYRVVKGVTYLTNLLYSNSDNEWETGPLCHALHALTLYDQRMFEPYDKPTQTAQDKPAGTNNNRPSANSTSRRTNSNTSASSAMRSSNRSRSR